MAANYDLVIVGGGLVGAGFCLALQSSGLRIALIDARLPSNTDPRLFALNDGSCQFLAHLGVWPSLAPHAAPIHQVHVSHQGHFGSVRLHREEAELPALGHVIPAYLIETALNEQLTLAANKSTITVYRPAKLAALEMTADKAYLTLETPDGPCHIETAIVIGADGTESSVRTLANIDAKIIDYDQQALVTRTLLQRPHKQIAYERFTNNGAIAMLPLTGNECATIWSSDSNTINELMAGSDTDFINKLQTHVGYRLGRLVSIRQRHVFPLRMVRALQASKQAAFLLGNSAHTLHPIAAQGFNLALYEVAALVEGILQKCAQKDAITVQDLEKFSEQTQKQQQTSIGISHRLSTIFTTDSALISIALQLGMVSLDIATPVKKRFIKNLMGRTGRVPSLLLGSKDYDQHFKAKH